MILLKGRVGTMRRMGRAGSVLVGGGVFAAGCMSSQRASVIDAADAGYADVTTPRADLDADTTARDSNAGDGLDAGSDVDGGAPHACSNGETFLCGSACCSASSSECNEH